MRGMDAQGRRSLARPIFCCCWNANPRLRAINAHVKQKPIAAEPAASR